ncbi:MAG: hypothetical protein OEZ59_14175, partial [Deltaproteobacteria bacterium]|nr:hypothetical protein [Deltaproteobacteria bacterium]
MRADKNSSLPPRSQKSHKYSFSFSEAALELPGPYLLLSLIETVFSMGHTSQAINSNDSYHCRSYLKKTITPPAGR